MKAALIALVLLLGCASVGPGPAPEIKSPQEFVCAAGGLHDWMCDPYDCGPPFDLIIDLRCYDATMLPSSKVAYYHQPTNEQIWLCMDSVLLEYPYLSIDMAIQICGLD